MEVSASKIRNRRSDKSEGKKVNGGRWSVKKMNHENTKSKNHEMFRANFRVFVMKKRLNIQHRILNFLLTAKANLTPETRNLEPGNSDNF